MVPVVASGRRVRALQGAGAGLWGRAIDGQECSTDERHGHDPRGRPDRKRRRRAAVHLLLPPDGLHPRARRRPTRPSRARRRRTRSRRSSPTAGCAPKATGRSARTPASSTCSSSGGRSAGWNPPRSLQEVVDEGVRRAYNHPENKLRASILADPAFTRRNTRDNTPCVLSVEMVPGRDGLGRRRRQGRRQREQVQVQDDEPERQHRRLGARDDPADGRRVVPAGDARDRHRRHRRARGQARQA